MAETDAAASQPTLTERLASTIGAEMSMRQSPAQIAWQVMQDVALTLNEWADEADDTDDAPFNGNALRWAAEEFERHGAPFGRVGPPARKRRAAAVSAHGIEQDRRDFMRDNPHLYVYIAQRAAAQALKRAGDRISGHHEAANIVWSQAAFFRAMYEASQTGA